MNVAWTPSDELTELVEAVCTDQITAEQTARLEALVLAEPMARRYYVRYLHLHASLPQILLSHEDCESDNLAAMIETDNQMLAGIFVPQASSPPVPISIAENLTSSTNGFTPSYGLPGKLWHGTIGFFSQELPFSLLIATVVTGLGLLFGSMVFVSHHKQIANDIPRPATPAAIPEIETDIEFVGRITGMVDVQWSDNQTATVHGANVPLGRKYALASGLMEITYHTGAKVLLQGPVTYQVDSPAGGYLSLGKLTARLEKNGPEVSSQGSEKVASGQWSVASEERSGVRGQRSDAANQKSEIRNQKSTSPAFAVRTPTATVTDLGTEFGVVAAKNQQAEVHVFRGKVEVQRRNSVGHVLETVQLTENEALFFDSTSSPSLRRRVSPGAFVTVFQRKQMVQPTAWYKFDNITNGLVLRTPDSSGHGRSASLLEMDRSNCVPGKSGNALAFNLDKEKLNQRVSMPWSPSFDMVGKSFTFALWLKRLKAGSEEHETILHKEGGDHGGYSIMRDRDSGKLVFRARNATGGWVWIKTDTSDEDAPKGVWVHFAVVGEFAESSGLYDVRLYRNGLRVGGHQNVEMATMPLPLSIGGLENGWAFRGALDDVQIYHQTLHDKQIMFLVQHPGELPSVDEAGNSATR